MSAVVQECFSALADQWRAGARRFMEEAEETRWSADLDPLTAIVRP
jgi:hypothetical protein